MNIIDEQENVVRHKKSSQSVVMSEIENSMKSHGIQNDILENEITKLKIKISQL